MSSRTEPASNPWRPKAVIFDLLTALLDSWTLWDHSTPSGAEDQGRRWRKRYLEITFGSGAYVPYEELVRAAARDTNLPESAADNLLQHWEDLIPWPEVFDVLGKLQARGFKLGVVTNCSKELGHAAARNVWRGFEAKGWDIVMTAEESGFYKPVDKAYLAALAALKMEAHEVLFVAGSAGDLEGARKAGMQVVWHNRVGLAKVGDAEPMQEGRTLYEALRNFL